MVAALRPLRLPALLLAIMLVTLAALYVAPQHPWLVAAPLLITAAVWAVLRLPVRYPVFALFFLVLTVDNVPERPFEGFWFSPLYDVGLSLFAQLNALTGIEALRVPGLDLWILLLLGVAIVRRATGSRIDLPVTPMPWPVVGACAVTLVTIVWMTVYGALRGGDVRQSLWQWHQLAMMPLLILLFHFALRGPEDWPVLRRILISAAFIKACFGAYFIVFIARPNAHDVEFSTSHSDSMTFLFACASALAPLLERPSWRLLGRAAAILSVVGMGMYYNDRRLAYVGLIGCLLILFFMQPPTAVKRRLQRTLVLLSPLLVLYVGVGWSSRAPAFSPVQTLRSVIDGEHGDITDYRDLENWDLVMTWRPRPLLGSGYGHVFYEPIKLPYIAGVFPNYGYHPHNAVLGLFAFGGVVGVTGLWLYLVVTGFLASRAYRHTAVPALRESALCVLCMVLIYANQCFGDMAVISWLCTFIISAMVAYTGKLAVAVGAWPQHDTARFSRPHAPAPGLPEPSGR